MTDETFTREFIESLRTPKGGFTREQLAEWGVPWPPPKGWLKALIGKPLRRYAADEEARAAGERAVIKHRKALERLARSD